MDVLQDAERTKRWLAFYLCSGVLVLPAWHVLPVYFFCHEVVVSMLLFLSHSDAKGAMLFFETFMAPKINYARIKISSLNTTAEEISRSSSVADEDKTR